MQLESAICTAQFLTFINAFMLNQSALITWFQFLAIVLVLSDKVWQHISTLRGRIKLLMPYEHEERTKGQTTHSSDLHRLQMKFETH